MGFESISASEKKYFIKTANTVGGDPQSRVSDLVNIIFEISNLCCVCWGFIGTKRICITGHLVVDYERVHLG